MREKKGIDYSTFGAPMVGRSYQSTNYRYGFNGQEKDDEVTGSTGTTYTADYWEYDARLGRRWNTDPVVKHWESPYATFNNSPIRIADPSGADGEECGAAAPTATPVLEDQGTPIDLVKSDIVDDVERTKTVVGHESYTYTQTTAFQSRSGDPANTVFENVTPGTLISYNTLQQSDALIFTDANTGAVIFNTNGQTGTAGAAPVSGSFAIPAGTTDVRVTSTPSAPVPNPNGGPDIGSSFTVSVSQTAVIVFTQYDIVTSSGRVVQTIYNWQIDGSGNSSAQIAAQKRNTTDMGNANPPGGGPVAPAGYYSSYLAAGGIAPDLSVHHHNGVQQ